MAEQKTAPLTDAERAELEELRAEKARREEEERARRERAELEELRAQKAAPARRAAAKPAPEPGPEGELSSARRIGMRMVTSDSVDSEGVPTMPPAQKIVIAAALLAAIAFAVYQFIL